MRTFKDSDGREWNVHVTAWHLQQLHKKLDLKLNVIVDRCVAGFMSSDPALVGQVLWVLIESDAKARSVEEESFTKSLNGDTFEAALAALTDALIDFFPSAVRGPLRKGVAAARDRQLQLVSKFQFDAIISDDAEFPVATEPTAAVSGS